MKKYYIGVDLGGTNTRVALLNSKFNILQKVAFPTGRNKRPSQILSAIAVSIREILKSHRIRLNQVMGIGIGMPGQVNVTNGRANNLTNLPGWRGLNISGSMKKKIRLPVYIDNDANVMALGEFYAGAGRGSKNIICITLGTGVGGGIILDGKIYRGGAFSAGEIGHIPINEEGPHCNCGGRACIEAYAGNGYIVKDVVRSVMRGARTALRKMSGGDLASITPKMIFEAARAKDAFALKIWDEVGRRLGIMLSGIINLLNPDTIIIGGGVAGAGKFIFPALRRTVKLRAMGLPARHVKIARAMLGEEAGLVGAAVLVAVERNG